MKDAQQRMEVEIRSSKLRLCTNTLMQEIHDERLQHMKRTVAHE